jgi:hypothetical protein
MISLKKLLEGFAATTALMLVGVGTSFGQTTECSAAECDLVAGQTTVVGKISVSNDETNLYITYTLDQTKYPGSYFEEELQVWAGNDVLNVPKNSQGIPVPGQFCDSDGGACSGENGLPSAIGLATYTFTIPFEQLNITNVLDYCDTALYIFAHSSVVYDKDGDGAVDDTDTAWGGCIGVNISEPGRWYYYMQYTICCDEEQPDQFCTTAYGKGGYVWTTDRKSNPETLPSLRLTKNRWGWATKLTEPTTVTSPLWAGAGLNNTASGKQVGTVTINWDGSVATVTYTLFAGNSLEEIHVYVGDNAPTTIAPGQYGYTREFDPNLTQFTSDPLPLVDSNGGGVWIVAHAVVCYPMPN